MTLADMLERTSRVIDEMDGLAWRQRAACWWWALTQPQGEA